jgi:hypothetical protein
MLQIALAVWGIIILVTGKLTVSSNKVVLGTPARLLGLVMIAPLPLTFVISIAVMEWAAANRHNINDLIEPLEAVQLGLVIGAAVLTYVLAFIIAKPPGEPSLALGRGRVSPRRTRSAS